MTRPRLRRLGQEPVDELKGRAALESGRGLGTVEDQRQARRDHEVRGVQLRSAEDPVGDPGVDPVEHRGKVGEGIALRGSVDGKHEAPEGRDYQTPRECAPVKEIAHSAVSG